MTKQQLGVRGVPGRTSGAMLYLVLCLALGSFSCGSDETAQASSSPVATVSDEARISDSQTGWALTNDFERVFFPKDTEIVGKIGRDNGVQRRAFVSATVLYQPPLSVEDVAHFAGGDPNASRDLVAMRCRPTDRGKVEPILATWPNVFNAVLADLGSTYTRADCPASSSDPVDRQVYCTALSFEDQADTKVPLVLSNAFAAGAEMFTLQGAPFQLTGSKTGADVLYDLYGIGYGFSGLGFSAKNSLLNGKSVALTAGQALEQSVVSEYLLKSVTLVEANCRCVRVKPYSGRDQGLLNWDAVWGTGDQSHCASMTKLP